MCVEHLNFEMLNKPKHSINAFVLANQLNFFYLRFTHHHHEQQHLNVNTLYCERRASCRKKFAWKLIKTV